MTKNRLALITGSGLVLVITVLLLLLPLVIDIERVRLVLYSLTGKWHHGNPFRRIQLFGGIPGAVVAGYYARNKQGYNGKSVAVKYGLAAAVLGLFWIYIAYVSYVIITVSINGGGFPPPIYLILIQPFIFAIVFFPAFVISGVIGGLIGYYL